VPYCESCEHYRDPDELEEGRCPGCGASLGAPRRAPWHFKLLVVATVVYLGFRAWQGLDWVVAHL